MRKLAAVLALVAVTVSSQATNIYRCRFRPDMNPPCWSTGTFCDINGNCWNIIANGYNTYTLQTNDLVTISLNVPCACPGWGTTEVGHTWMEVSTNQGLTWSLVSPTFVAVIMPEGAVTSMWNTENGQLVYWGSPGLCPGGG
jgi:hypothetical protein